LIPPPRGRSGLAADARNNVANAGALASPTFLCGGSCFLHPRTHRRRLCSVPFLVLFLETLLLPLPATLSDMHSMQSLASPFALCWKFPASFAKLMALRCPVQFSQIVWSLDVWVGPIFSASSKLLHSPETLICSTFQVENKMLTFSRQIFTWQHIIVHIITEQICAKIAQNTSNRKFYTDKTIQNFTPQ